MRLNLYKSQDDSRVCLKALLPIRTITLEPNGELNLLYPKFTVPYDEKTLTANYCRIEEFNRYYFINSMSLLNGTMVSISCSVDPLMSFYNNYKSSIGYCIRNQNNIQPWVKDDLRPIFPYTNTRVLKLENSIFNIDSADPNDSTNFILMVSGAIKKQ